MRNIKWFGHQYLLGAQHSPQETILLSQLLTLQVLNTGPAEFTTTKTFDQLMLAVGGLVSTYWLELVEAYAGIATPLPVVLAAFQGQAVGTGEQLSWQTASMLNNSYFTVGRATGSKEAASAELSRVAGAGSSPQARCYQFVDAAPGLLNYYCLRQVDADSAAHYSPVVAARAAPGG